MTKKQVFEDKFRAELDELTAKIDMLKAKAQKAEAGTRVKYNEAIADLQAKQSFARDRLNRFHNASEDAWVDLKKGIETAWSDLGDAVRSATSHFR